MNIKKYTHKIKKYSEKWLKKPEVIEISLPYIPEKFTRPDEIAESYHIDINNKKKGSE
tara:strand:+ start:6914 stop:7087 length:174 start_codon:yes stop_codon:yes gene_type:complete